MFPFALPIAMVASSNVRTGAMPKLLISGFLVVHGFLHAIFMSHPNDEFTSVLSNTLIFGGAVFGGIYVIVDLLSKSSSERDVMDR